MSRRSENLRKATAARKAQQQKWQTLEYQLVQVLSEHCGQRGDNEGAVETLRRIINERDSAMTLLALDRMRHPHTRLFF